MTNIKLNSDFETKINRFGYIPLMWQTMKLMLEVEEKIAGKEDTISLGIKSCIYQKLPAAKILNEIKEMAEDNYAAIGFLLSNKLTDKILAL